MKTISDICIYIAAITMITTPVLFLIWLIKRIQKKPSKRIGIAVLVSLACFVMFFLAGGFTNPATYCDHEYKLVEKVATTCEKDGFEKYHCDLCGSDKTEKPKKLGHDMVDVHRVEPTYDADGEYVRRCTRCGYEEIEVLEKLERPAEKPTEAQTEPTGTEETALNNNWKESFKNAGFTDAEIAQYREIIEKVGITEFHDVEIIENGIMHIVRGKVFNDKNLQLNVTLENRKIIYIELAGIPDTEAKPYFNWRGELKFKTVNTKKAVELFSDTDGGYVGVVDWDAKFIYACDSNGNILE